ncbi:MAG: CoA-binding protein [Pseudomonadota bacterium]|nr:CoA-binding protein [Pseudomonadota bacterium]
MEPEDHHVVVLGASPKPQRYSNQAVRLLKSKGYRVSPVNPAFVEIEGLPVYASLGLIVGPVHTLTLYVSPKHIEPAIEDIVKLRPGRVIFNPGTETPVLERRLARASIPHFDACTLVMLRTNIF